MTERVQYHIMQRRVHKILYELLHQIWQRCKTREHRERLVVPEALLVYSVEPQREGNNRNPRNDQPFLPCRNRIGLDRHITLDRRSA